ncbi:DctP family TRAP transporter solute-binding subunit [Cognatiyoonia sp. IB215182]|uniref:DctP family TRAP transporter solute-binding subunit n=1 Tax=Cognatiyoonia sp. IB215182 TaxID=3097353 RepID=UPI002A0E142D|nr:DctP family TRAP transporter solute-binding subunit [Cognatiyoonia sp. IB215182]MDX8352457.1 DctP family TRAP transporter solute-binding subunit [Cognatiyoonia sp. IB215182]
MKFLRNLLAAAVTVLPAPLMAESDACDPGEQVTRFSLVTSLQGHPKGEAALAFAEQVNEQLDGIMCVEVYGSSELYNDDDVFQAMLDGDVHFAAPGLAKFQPYTDQFELFNLPFLFDGPLQVMAFLETDMAQSLTAGISDDGFVGLGYWANGMRQYSASVPMRLPSDASGLSFRVSSSSPVTAEVLRRMNVTPVKLSFSKVYDALASGEVQGQENTWANIQTKEFYLEQAAVTETNHTYIGYLVVTSQAFLDSLDPETRQTIIDIMDLTTHERNRFAFEINQARRQDILDDDGVIITLTPEELAIWRAEMLPVWDQFRSSIGGELIDAAVEINATVDPFN